MNNLFSNSINMAQKSLDYLWKKQGLIADNIANEDTPGYKSRYLTFENELKKSLSKVETGTSDEYGHIIDNTEFKINTTENQSARLDGNNVNTDAEYVELARTSIQYQYAVRAMNDEFTRLKSVIKG
ncbi:MAG: flagellar basal body rod protein FlgB [Proteocatella sp.]